jgi:hypothetical protein
MTKTFAQAVSLALAAAVTAATFAGANSMATQQYAKAEAVVAIDQAPMLALQRVVIVGHRT